MPKEKDTLRSVGQSGSRRGGKGTEVTGRGDEGSETSVKLLVEFR